MKVVVVADNECLLRGLTSMLSSLPSVRSVSPHDAESSARLMDSDEAVDLFILRFHDLEVDVTRRLAGMAREREVKLLLLLDNYHEDMLDDLVDIPSSGFLMGDTTTEALRVTLESLSRGDHLPMPGAMARTLMTRAGSGQQKPVVAALTPREFEVLELMVDGLSNKQIARRLAISPNGVKRLVSCVLAKFNCANRTQAVVMALNLDLLN